MHEEIRQLIKEPHKPMSKSKSTIKYIWDIRFYIPPTIALLAIAWLAAYAYMFTYWQSIILVEKPTQIEIIHTVKAETAPSLQ